jgi:hypothetical protein
MCAEGNCALVTLKRHGAAIGSLNSAEGDLRSGSE